MNSNHRQGKHSGTIAIALAMLAAVVMFVGALVPAQAQTFPVAFPAPTTFASAGHCCPSTVAVATGDFNGDGKLDVVNIDSGSDLNVILGNGDGTFQTPISLNIAMTNIFYEAIAVGDFNGDHLLDVALWTLNATTGNTEVHIFLGNGAGSLTFSTTYSAPNSNIFNPGPNSIVAADVNGDGKLDLVGVTINNGVFIFLGNGDGSFQTPANYGYGRTSGCCTGVAVGDLNGDGKPDLALPVNDGISILLNNGNGTFGAATYYASGISGSSPGAGIAIGDVSGDKKPDVVVTNENFGVIIYLNQGGGTFAVKGPLGSIPIGATDNVVLADINNDRKLDIVIPDTFGDVFTFYGKGNGTFTAGPGYPLQAQNNAGNYLVAVGDFNGDGTLDLLDTNGFNTNTVSLGRGDGTFQTNQLYASISNFSSSNIATADFNGDGFPDVALVGNVNGKIGISLGSSHGALGTTSLVIASTCANNVVEWVATGDVNGDGKADLVATLQDASFAGCQNNTVAVLTGKGTGKFNKAVYYSTGSTAQEGVVYLTDVNGDGKLDIVTENADGTISVLLNKGNGTYNPGTLITSIAAINPGRIYLTFADFNGDGKMDIAVATAGNLSAVYVLLGSGNRTFGAPIQTATPYYPITLAAADFNKDGKADLLVTTTANGCTNNDRGYAFLKGNGDGTFTAGSINCLPYQSPAIPVVADLNGDGKLDVVIPNSGGTIPTGPAVLQGNGDGTFTSSELFYSGEGAISAAVADFNGDGMPDVALVNDGGFNPSFVSVMFNSTQPVSVSPLNVNYGSVTVGAKKAETVILTNDQSTSLAINSVTLSGANAGDFSAKSACGSSRKAGWDCTITVTFTPTVTGARNATLNIKDAVGTQTVQLNGAGK
jgi:hypothetical protein